MVSKKFPVVGVLIKCSKCGRKILVERGIFGVDHTIGTFGACWECLDVKTKQRVKKIYKIKEE